MYIYIRAATFLGLTRRTASRFMSHIAGVTLFRKPVNWMVFVFFMTDQILESQKKLKVYATIDIELW